MLMKTREPDFFYVEPQHKAIHEELENWARWVEVRHPRWMSPIWKLGKSNGRQWHEPELRIEVRPLAAAEMEKKIYFLPEKQRAAIRWWYVYKHPPARECRKLGVSYEGLANLVRIGRVMLINRGCVQ